MLQITGVILAIITIITLTRKGVNLGSSMLMAALLVAIFSGMGPANIFNAFTHALIEPTTVRLMLIVFLIGILGNLLKQTSSLDKMLDSLSKIIPDKRILALSLPSLIGMLTVPGGAVLSCPMVEKAGNKIELSSIRIAAINMFYRHIWHLVFPLIPSFILISEMSQVSLKHYITFNLPVIIITFFVSIKWLFRGLHSEQIYDQNYQLKAEDVVKFIQSILPTATSIILAILFDIYLPLALSLGIILAMLNYIDFRNGNPKAELRERLSYVIEGINFNMILTIIGIMVFKYFIELSGAVDTIAVSLINSGVPPLALTAIIPLLVSGIIGVNTASIGISYPILAPMVFTASGFSPLLGVFYVSSVIGYLLSPFHLCLILTRDYFDIPLKSIYKELSIPAHVMAVTTLITAIIWTIF